MGDSAEDRSAADTVLGEVDRGEWCVIGLGRGQLSEGAVWSCARTVVQVLGQDAA
jgi:hypothetical protein